ncbi:ribosome biogenesis GTPase YlqF [Tepidanaerobacter sp. EBM-49]|uniref:ribosome biogenesis GTPase YlqF n=1 Tax=Tepidanaerobacter sp. EBM-49 TaxID=1918504 RepID=UPI000A7D578E|nr:ribosome biogenesis GTPase YlqF [Tepidanaerobacter sp. EBM-49]
MDIQWYPGHMEKAKKSIKNYLKLADSIIEIVDARAPVSTRIKNIEKLASGKNIIIVLNKADLADLKITQMWLEYFNSGSIMAIAINALKKSELNKLYGLLSKPKNKSRIAPLRCVVVGAPNVGKSTFINQIKGRKTAKTGDFPGITKNIVWIKASDDLELLDTPGILQPKYEDRFIAAKLAILGTINPDILDFEELAKTLIEYLLKNYPTNIEKRYGVSLDFNSSKVLESIGKARGFLTSGGSVDIERTAKTVIKEFQEGKLGRISLERPDEMPDKKD